MAQEEFFSQKCFQRLTVKIARNENHFQESNFSTHSNLNIFFGPLEHLNVNVELKTISIRNAAFKFKLNVFMLMNGLQRIIDDQHFFLEDVHSPFLILFLQPIYVNFSFEKI